MIKLQVYWENEKYILPFDKSIFGIDNSSFRVFLHSEFPQN